MKRFNFIFSILALLALVAGCCTKSKVNTDLPTTVEAAVASNLRTSENLKRDQYRHPVETLNFFGIKPEMTVVEISPGAGWYMEILAPYLTVKGQYIGAAFPKNTDKSYFKDMNQKINTWLEKNSNVKANIVEFNPPTPIVQDNSADMVLTFRNVHNWMPNEKAAFESFYKALKPGGILGVVEHRANPKVKRDPKAANGYVLEKDVIKVAESVGFKLQAKSEINANLKDTKDHPEGVWTLPPVLRLKEKDQEKYLAIGESDRMTLRFVKPAK